MNLNYKNQNYNINILNRENSIIANINNKEISIESKSEYYLLGSENNNAKAYFVKDEKHIYIWIEGNQFTFDIPKSKDEISYTNAGDSLGSGSVKSPMPGNVIKVLVEIGQEVKNGDALIIVEAMKMESTLFSTVDGKVSIINAKSGQQIDSDFVLIEIE